MWVFGVTFQLFAFGLCAVGHSVVFPVPVFIGLIVG